MIVNQNITGKTGFTLIELMIVMAIMALLMGLVGPLTIGRYEKTQAIEESLSFKNWVVANSYRAFATGHGGVFTLAGKKATFTYQPDSLDPLPLSLNESEVEQNSSRVISSREFEFVFFQPQAIDVNSFGIINDKSIIMTVAGKTKTLLIDKDIYDYAN